MLVWPTRRGSGVVRVVPFWWWTEATILLTPLCVDVSVAF